MEKLGNPWNLWVLWRSGWELSVKELAETWLCRPLEARSTSRSFSTLWTLGNQGWSERTWVVRPHQKSTWAPRHRMQKGAGLWAAAVTPGWWWQHGQAVAEDAFGPLRGLAAWLSVGEKEGCPGGSRPLAWCRPRTEEEVWGGSPGLLCWGVGLSTGHQAGGGEGSCQPTTEMWACLWVE